MSVYAYRECPAISDDVGGSRDLLSLSRSSLSLTCEGRGDRLRLRTDPSDSDEPLADPNQDIDIELVF